MSTCTGELHLGMDVARGRSYARRQRHHGTLRVIRPHYYDDTGQATYLVINPGGAYFSADSYLIDLDLAPEASLLLATQSATKVYRTPRGPATQRTTVRLAEGAVLESLPDQIIVYREGGYRQDTHVRMHPGSTYVATEVLTPGWSPTGADFAYHELRMRTRIDVEAADACRVLAVDHLRVVPDPGTTGIGVMEGYTHLGQLLVADRRVDAALVDEVHSLVDHEDVRAGVSLLDPVLGVGGLAVRVLGNSTPRLTELNLAVVDLLRRRWRGQPPVSLRKS